MPPTSDGTAAPTASVRRSRHALTLLEVLVVIGIMAVLATIAVWGYGRMQSSNKAKLTAQMLANSGGMFREYERASGAKGVPKDAVPAPGVVKEGAADRNGPVVRQTREVMAMVRGVTVNDAAIKALPPSHVWPGATPAEGPVVLDAWYNPVIFVPAGGLGNVTKNGTAGTVVSPDGKPFFASAGADASFETGDDNLYSFED